MKKIENSIEIEDQLERVYSLARGVYSFPECMPNLNSMTVVERSDDGSRIVSECVGFLPEIKAKFRWTAEDIWDDRAHACAFSLLEGGYGSYSGQWRFTDLGDRTRFDSEIEVECNVPLIRGFVAKKVKANVDSLMAAIKAKAECK